MAKYPAIAALFAFLIIPLSVQAASYYVDKNSMGGACSDGGAGTLNQPWCTISKAASTLVAGDTVYIRAGIYYENLAPSNSGSPGSPITYTRYGSETAIIDGSEQITGWTQDSGNKYKANVTFTPDAKFTSNPTAYNCISLSGGLVLQDGAKLNFCMEANAAAVNGEGKYFMDDSSGCSVVSPCTLYVYLKNIGSKGYNPNNYEMRIGKLRNAFNLNGGQDYLTIDGLEIRRSQDNGIHTIGATNLVVRNSKIYSHHTTGIYFTASSDNALIELNEFWDNNHGGIENFGSNNNVIRRNIFKKVDLGNGYGGNGGHIYSGGIGTVSNNTTIENNIMYETTTQAGGSTGAGMQLWGDYNKIRYNTIYKWANYAGIVLRDGANFEVKNNILYDDGGAGIITVMVLAVSDGGHVISYNDFYSSTGGFYAWNGTAYNTLSAWQTASGQSNNIASNPLFTNLTSRDFHLTSLSPAIDSGINVGMTTDHEGNLRPQGTGYDMGAYEYLSQDTTPPVRSSGSPSGVLPSGTLQATLSLTTDETATCKYSTNAGVAYPSIPYTFTNTNSSIHSTLITGLQDGQTYTYYVRCIDTSGNYNSDDFIITFSINASQTCTDSDNDSFYKEPGCGTAIDCSDTNSSIHPGAREICSNGIDEDCSGQDLACHRSDTNKNGCTDMSELTAFIDKWKLDSSDVTLRELMEAIGLWKMGC